MRRFTLLVTAFAALALPIAASAHPLGNFTTNRYSEVSVSGQRLYVLYVLDLAEIPTFQNRARVTRLGRVGYGRALAAAIAGGVELRVDRSRRPLQELRRSLSFPAGVGGLRTTRLELLLDAGAAPRARPLRLDYVDRNYPSRLGWKEVVVTADDGAKVVTANVPATSVSRRLRAYPSDLLQSPLDVEQARARVETGSGPGVPPRLGAEREAPSTRATSKSETGFAALISEEELGFGIILASLLAAMFWGAAHALTPGHGKAIVAAYMVGTRGRARDAALLGLTVTVTHTIGVFALGLVTLALSEFVVPEDLYPWLNLVSALLVVAVGLTVFRIRIAGRLGRGDAGAHGHHHHHHHSGDGEHGHHHDHGPGGHSHAPAPGTGFRGLVAVGVSGGLLPCPTALVVLLAAISLHRVAYGLVLIVAFSVGLAIVVTGIGLLAVTARRTFRRMSFEGPLVRALPSVSALIIIGLGLAMTVRALPSIT